jgi:hypothetical protein
LYSRVALCIAARACLSFSLKALHSFSKSVTLFSKALVLEHSSMYNFSKSGFTTSVTPAALSASLSAFFFQHIFVLLL